MKGQAPIALSESQPASRQATGSARQPGQAFEDTKWKRQMARVEGFPRQETESIRNQKP